MKTKTRQPLHPLDAFLSVPGPQGAAQRNADRAFAPQTAPESLGDKITRAARLITESEAASREASTVRLRKLRLANEAGAMPKAGPGRVRKLADRA
ncbi:hypothetical protein [Wenxinia marina]|uniref:Uncharacterized protein n=1 Tax=Wenxinia marina DSM 24838 TaxID=1123501 RepID=A0A0D0NSY7_9RHOB|nr:hypothetical protein [Wenxinia marina]KIQ71305.1 hypothetical protein Wenmar_00074 [Wenxinia marina DSM 24838]GGL73749.1 hypothetical protein GCM10011392_30330 [Wenxinia marina]